MRSKTISNPLRTIEKKISRDTIVSQVAAFLYASGVVQDNEEVLDIEFGDTSKELVSIKIKIKGDSEVKFIRLNG